MSRFPLIALIGLLISSCKAYKQDIMFKLDENFSSENLSQVTDSIESNYQMKPGDALLLDVFTNGGERLIDPQQELNQAVNLQQQFKNSFFYTIQVDGVVAFPVIGDVKLNGMTLFEAETVLMEKYNVVYKGSFVKLRITNRRVFVLGAPGGKVVPLPNEGTNIVEVLAFAEGLGIESKAQNIKLIRGKEVFRIDLSTISGMMDTNMLVEPGDVIYIEPWRRPWLETLRDVSPALSLISSVLTLIVVVQNL